MTVPIPQPSFAAGELSPDFFGRFDHAKYKVGASTCRNFFVSYRGGAVSRPGTALASGGRLKQNGLGPPPRIIRFQFNINQAYVLEFGDHYLRFLYRGAYVLQSSSRVSITGLTQTAPPHLSYPLNIFSNGDQVFVTGVSGMTQVNNRMFLVGNAAPNTFDLYDLYDLAVNATGYSPYAGGGTATRVYEIATPYGINDVPMLKFAQSADVMTLTHPNYPIQELRRFASDNWTLTPAVIGTSVGSSPTGLTAVANVVATTNPTAYQYVVTAVGIETGEESQRSNIASVVNSVDLAATQGSITLTWLPVDGAGSYNIYRSPPAYNGAVAIGTPWGLIATVFGLQFTDTNSTPDFTKTPPLHQNPFDSGQVLEVQMTAGGGSYTSTPGYAITTAAGTGFSGSVFLVGNTVGGILIEDHGHGFQPGDTIAFTGGGGSGAAANLVIGPTSGNNPSVVAYYQERRVYGNTLNNPDTLYASQPGAFENMDVSNPTIDSDAITATPWSEQVNGIQQLVPMPGGLVVLTGSAAWQVAGIGSSGAINPQPITPSNTQAQAQAFNGCHDHIPAQKINYDILYVQAKGSIVRDLQYNFFVNIYTGTDITIFANHLFKTQENGISLVSGEAVDGVIREWAWAEEPFKIVWVVLENGTLLSLTYLKEQEVQAWARHDTNGLFASVCSVTEPPVDAVYFVVGRTIPGKGRQWFIERMDDRSWVGVEDAWCVDCGAQLPPETPNATLEVQNASGMAVPVFASQPVFGSGDIGKVIRSGGGKMTVTSVSDSRHFTVDISAPILQVMPNDPTNTPIPQPSGAWTIAAPVTVIGGLDYLEGMTVAILADGVALPNQQVIDGMVTLPHPATLVTVGLPFQCQLQTMYLEVPGGVTGQGRRKNVFAVTTRVTEARGVKVGSNQLDASTTPPLIAARWSEMQLVKDPANDPMAGTSLPLFTGDLRAPIIAEWVKPGQRAFQQDYPLPCTVLAEISEVDIGDDPG